MDSARELDLRMTELDEGDFVKIRVTFPNGPKVYTYAAVVFGGKVFMSGVDSLNSKTWAELISWYKLREIEVLSIEVATAWKDVL